MISFATVENSMRRGTRVRKVARVLLSLALIPWLCAWSAPKPIAAPESPPFINFGKSYPDRHAVRSGYRELRTDRPAYVHPYAYARPVYPPTPVYVEPYQSPGISFFFPLEIR
jgi:hypothetical protein